jgi:hypothetical protein
MRAHLADAGFASHPAFTLPTEGITLIAITRTGGLDGQTPARRMSPERQRMAARLDTPAGSRRRMGRIEPVFRHLTQHGGRDFHFRGPARQTELTIMSLAHNTAKLLKRCQSSSVILQTTRAPLKTLTIRNRHVHPRGRLTPAAKGP